MTRPSDTAIGVTTWVIPARRLARRAPWAPQLLDSLTTFAAALGLGLGLALLLASCSGRRLEAAPERSSSHPAMSNLEAPSPSLAVTPVAADRLCVTKGAASLGGAITEPTVRAVALGTSGEAASLTFRFLGDTATTHELASGESRRQLGLKLRAQDGCNLVYVMWRLDPKPGLSVSVKHNPGMRTHKECGADGYTRVKPLRGAALAPVPALHPDASHILRAELSGDDLLAWIDDQLVWRGPLPAAARTLSGPAGLRSDNVRYDLVGFSAAAAPAAAAPAKCSPEHGD